MNMEEESSDISYPNEPTARRTSNISEEHLIKVRVNDKIIYIKMIRSNVYPNNLILIMQLILLRYIFSYKVNT